MDKIKEECLIKQQPGALTSQMNEIRLDGSVVTEMCDSS